MRFGSHLSSSPPTVRRGRSALRALSIGVGLGSIALLVASASGEPKKIPWPKNVPMPQIERVVPPIADLPGDRGPREVLVTTAPGSLTRVRLAQGAVVVYMLWASWCPACRQEVPIVDAVGRTYRARGVHVIAASVDENPDALDSFLAKTPLHADVMRLLRWEPGELDGALAKFGAKPYQAIPRTLIISKSGKLLADWTGVKSQVDFSKVLGHALASSE